MWALALLALGLSALSDHVAAKTPPRSPLYLSQVVIQGNRRFKTAEIREVMSTRARSWWRVFSPRPKFDRLTVIEDTLRIRRYYRLRGFFGAKVTWRTIRRGRRVNLVIAITEGRPVVVRRVRVMVYGFLRSAWARKVRGLIKVKAGQRLDLIAYRRNKQAIAVWLADRGHARAQILGRVLVSLKQRAAWIKLRVAPGPRYRFGPVTMNQDKLNRSTFDRALTFKPGQVFSVARMRSTRLRLLNLRLFRSVSLHPDWPKAKDLRVPIRVSLTRSPPNKIKIGIGYGTEELFRASLMYIRRDPFNLGGRFEVVGRYSSRRRGFESRWIKPYFLDRRTNFKTSFGFERHEEVSYVDDEWWLDFTIVRQQTRKWTFLARLRLARHEPRDIYVGTINAVGLTGSTARFYREHFLTLGLTYDSTDNPLYPTSGLRLGLGLDLATGLLGSEVRYLKPSFYVTRFWPLWGKLVLSARARALTVTPIEGATDVYIFNRLFLGGAWSVRGYDYQKLGPLDPEGRPVGGRTSIELGLELMFPLIGRLKGVVFVEAGQVHPQAFSLRPPRPADEIGRVTAHSLGFRYTAGFGVRYNTPIGPIRLDIGFKLNRPEALPSDYAIQFSIGQTF
ncbi:MAG: BamA/TamA family outer membrane protein [Proteobacteria bacterium]|nr:BamA/TamA family outer membrane protein [Pseudomonadota bacterium]